MHATAVNDALSWLTAKYDEPENATSHTNASAGSRYLNVTIGSVTSAENSLTALLANARRALPAWTISSRSLTQHHRGTSWPTLRALTSDATLPRTIGQPKQTGYSIGRCYYLGGDVKPWQVYPCTVELRLPPIHDRAVPDS
jgi:hypothetical protein